MGMSKPLMVVDSTASQVGRLNVVSLWRQLQTKLERWLSKLKRSPEKSTANTLEDLERSLCDFFDFKNPEVKHDFLKAIALNKYLFIYALTLSWVAEYITNGKRVFITDVERYDLNSTHNYQRAFDARVFYAPRGDDIILTITELEWKVIENRISKILEYKGQNSLIIVHGDGFHRHAHNQIATNYPVVKV